MKPKPMPPKLFKQIRENRQLTKRDLANFFKVNWVTVWRWETGKTPIPHWVPIMLRGLQ